MTEKNVLLHSIYLNPQDNTVRLAYADWVEEGNGNEVDKARAEHIRIALRNGKKATATPRDDERHWLRHNCHRLIDDAADQYFDVLGTQHTGGRSLQFVIQLRVIRDETTVLHQSASPHLRVDRGFITEVRWRNPSQFMWLYRYVVRCIPLARHTHTARCLDNFRGHAMFGDYPRAVARHFTETVTSKLTETAYKSWLRYTQVTPVSSGPV